MERLKTPFVVAVVCAVACAGSARHKESSRITPVGAPDSAFAGLSPQQTDHVVESFNRGMGLMDQYRPVEAAAQFDEVVKLAPQWVTGRVNLGIALLNTQDEADLVRAEKELKAAAGMEPDNPYAHFALGLLYSHQGRPDEAKREFERVVEIDPADPDGHYQLAITIIEENPAEARRQLETTLQIMPNHEAACYRLYTLLRREGDTEEANKVLARFQELKSSGAGENRELVYGEMGRYAQTMRAFEMPSSGPAQSPPAYSDVADEVGLGAELGGNPALGPGVACSDVDGDGDLDVFIPGLGLYLNDAGKFTSASQTGIDDTNAIGAYFGDYDGDGDPDLYLTCDGPNRLYSNNGSGTFADITAKSGTAGGAVVSMGAAWADADHDGDLDLYVCNYSNSGGDSGVPNNLWRNIDDGSFIDVAKDAGVDGGSAHTTSVLFFDVDDDRDLDLYLVNDHGANQLFRNDRVGRYEDVTRSYPSFDDDGPGLGALLGDVDSNGWEDVILLRGGESPRLLLQSERGQYVEDVVFSILADSMTASGGLLGDLDNDGDLDLFLLDVRRRDTYRNEVLVNERGNFGPFAAKEKRDQPLARGAVAADFDGDGSLELLVAQATGSPQLWRAPASKGHWLNVVPVAAAGSKLASPEAVGTTVEIKTGQRLQVASITSLSGYLGNPPPVLHFGLGRNTRVDYARLSWPDAVLQGELEIPSDQQWRIAKAARKPSSCPVLFSWDGEQFAFVTDFLGVGGMGFFMEPGFYGPPDPTEDVRIPPELIKADNGRYRLRVAEPLEEVTYLDQAHLIAYDHPADMELYPDERFTGSQPFPTGRPFAVSKKIFPVSAKTNAGENVLDRVAAVDRQYVELPRDPRFVGYADDHWVELNFGDRLKSVPGDSRLILYLYGWVEYTYSHVNYAAYQAGITMKSPWIEIPDGKGGWKVAVPEAGFPAGLPRMMTLDITALPVRDDGHMRIRTNMEVYWDQIFVGEDVFDARIKEHEMRPVTAELRYLGYPREYSPDGGDPTLYDYRRIDQGLAFKNLTGSFTRFGDVRELLQSVDDRFVIMARGEEIALDFDATTLPALPEGWSRTLVLHTDGYCKDMDLYTAAPDAVEPLPYHAMDNYPPVAPRPPDAAYETYRQTWNTRRVIGDE